MKVVRVLLVSIVAAAAASTALAQWKWRDRQGVVQYSDMPPPQSTPDKDILDRPRASVPRTLPSSAAPSAAAAPASAAARTPLDAQVDAQRRKAELDNADRTAKAQASQKADEQRVAAQRADNCQRARASLRSLEDGGRMVRTNAQGEREVLDDKGRAEEMARSRAVISADCR